MKIMNNYFKDKKSQEIMDIIYDDYTNMFQEGFSDTEISKELGVDENYVRKLREDYQSDY